MKQSTVRLTAIRQTALCIAVLVLFLVQSVLQAAPVELSKSGKPTMSIIVAPLAPEPEPAVPADPKKKASAKPVVKPPTTQDQAAALAEQLERITGGKFEIKTGPADSGIVVGTFDQFPGLNLAGAFSNDPQERAEQFIIKTHPKGVYIIGASVGGVRNGVWDFLHRVGYRQFFPGKNWEYVPSTPDLKVDIDVNSKPDYLSRRIWYGYGGWDFSNALSRSWQVKNLAVADFTLNTGHAYDNIIRENKALFDAHPEYYGLINGERKSSKFCIGNPDVIKLVVNYADNFFIKNPTADSVSVDPSDGGNWCECERCLAIGSPSNRALTVANEVGKMLAEKHPGKFVAMYAYNEHAPPPTIKARPEVIINVATAFTRGQSVDGIIKGWLDMGVKHFGIREYYSIYLWDKDLPGHARASDLKYLTRTIPHFRKMGARFMSAESSDNWGPNGLGYYIATRIMWDVREADRVDEIKEDFLSKSFGAAIDPMRVFYDVLLNVKPAPLSDDKIGRLYRQLDLAYKANKDPAVERRLDDLLNYVYFVELWSKTQAAAGNDRMALFEKTVRHMYRTRESVMVHTKGVHRGGPRVLELKVPAQFAWQTPDANNPWKQEPAYTRQELADILAKGIENNQLFAFTPVDFSTNLVPIPSAPKPQIIKPIPMPIQTRGVANYFFYVPTANGKVSFAVTSGLIAHYRDRGPTQVLVEDIGETDEFGPLATAEVPQDGNTHEVTFTIKDPGLYRLRVSDKSNKTQVVPADGTLFSLPAGMTSTPNVQSRISGFFYVPKGTKVVGGFATSKEGQVLMPDGKAGLQFKDKGSSYFAIPVPDGMDGNFWYIQKSVGPVRLMTVPAYLFASPAEALLPREVVEQDFPAAGK